MSGLDISAELALLGNPKAAEPTVLPEPPAEISHKAVELWFEVVERWSLSPTELVILVQAVETMTLLELISSAWVAEGRPMTTQGSMGQLVAHPALSEMRQQRALLRQLVSKLSLEDEGSTSKRTGRPTRYDAGKAAGLVS